eukprot:CAMPEP_0119043528 /NCGR_PEP_ID=MMETSP1177-20130426/23099_1 /TAXON_ID=2985 /ORGANISM="Ochromonas sp, Strain CCMP1899" /LENGTH=555 /DNA_ID=CAMNT_0007011825 /DNA_START=312 /DNA_END=1979 /DNA_ORIENTATION=+
MSPNFERLAKRSVVFDNAYSQISVCNPSRDSLLTGLRPDTVGTYTFQSSYVTYNDHLVLPTRLKRSGYKTAGYGKIRHWDGADPKLWDENFDGKWYDYQAAEWNWMNSSVMPDKNTKEELFPDYIFASEAIKGLKKYSKKDEYFMLAIGFKMPHLAMHMPYKYYDMYRSRVHMFDASPAELRFPPTAPSVSYRCCANPRYNFMNEEGAQKSRSSHDLQYINRTIPLTVHQEMMWGYAAMITFVDKQLGRVLDAIDELELWSNLTVVLTADHGMHNGEKGIWEKWSLFDESTHVPLIISHPLSPFKGQRYSNPVELIDVFPTINDLLGAPYSKRQLYGTDASKKGGGWSRKFIPLQGKSLAPLILGKEFRYRPIKANSKIIYNGDLMPTLNHTFALSQTWRCAPKDKALRDQRVDLGAAEGLRQWDACSVDKIDHWTETSVMGYSMRTLDFRYTMYIPFLRPHRIPIFEEPIFAEELYDHRGDKLSDLGHKEIVNLAKDPKFRTVLEIYRRDLRSFLYNEVFYLNLTGVTFNERSQGLGRPITSMKKGKKRIKKMG